MPPLRSSTCRSPPPPFLPPHHHHLLQPRRWCESGWLCIQNHESVSIKGRYGAARAAKKSGTCHQRLTWPYVSVALSFCTSPSQLNSPVYIWIIAHHGIYVLVRQYTAVRHQTYWSTLKGLSAVAFEIKTKDLTSAAANSFKCLRAPI